MAALMSIADHMAPAHGGKPARARIKRLKAFVVLAQPFRPDYLEKVLFKLSNNYYVKLCKPCLLFESFAYYAIFRIVLTGKEGSGLMMRSLKGQFGAIILQDGVLPDGLVGALVSRAAPAVRDSRLFAVQGATA